MKKITIKLFAIVGIAAMILSGCGGIQKMADNANLIKRKVTPNPLEMHGGKVALQIAVTFPPKYFDKEAYLVLTPYLVADDKSAEKQFRSQTLQGEKYPDNNPVIKYNEGGSYTYVDTIPYEDAYKMSDLELRIKATKGGESVDFITVKLADGIITTPLLVEDGLLVDNGQVGNTGKGLGKLYFESVQLPEKTTESQEVTLFYPLQKSTLRSSEMRKQEIKDFIEKVKQAAADEEKELEGISIASYASPDGPIDLNESLVEGRGDNSSSFIKKQLSKNKVEQVKDEKFITRETTPAEDWEGFKKVTQESNVKDKDLILRVLSMYNDPVVREKEIKNISEAYTELKDEVLPKLRRSEIKVTYGTKAKTDDEILKLSESNPEKLSDVEMMYAAQLTSDAAKKEAIYKKVVSKNANCWKAYNNLGAIQLQNNDLANAEQNLQKANTLKADNPGILNNLGVLYFAKGDYAKAEEYFKKAQSFGNNDAIGYNLGVIYIKQGLYSQAVQSFGAGNSYNKALAQALNGDGNAAMSTLDAMSCTNPKYFYLKAVVAARNSDIQGVVENLKKAIDGDATMKDKALSDMEFFKYFENELFKNIVQ